MNHILIPFDIPDTTSRYMTV